MANRNFYLKYNLTPFDKAINKAINSGLKTTAKDSRKAFKAIRKAAKQVNKNIKKANKAIDKKIRLSRKQKKVAAKGGYKKYKTTLTADTYQEGISKAFKKIQGKPQGHQAKDSLGKIQETLNYIQSNKRTNASITISADLASAMRWSIGDTNHDFAPGESNAYYEISPDWDGRESTLINYVTWKTLPNDPKAVKYLDKVSGSKWGSEKQHQEHLKEAYHTGYNNLMDQLNLKISDNMLEQLEGLMYSSAMWHVVGAGDRGYDSDQGKDDWSDIFVHLDKMVTKTKGKLQQTDLDKIVKLITDVENNPSYHPHAEDELQDLIDDIIDTYE